MSSADFTSGILIQILDEIRNTIERLDQTNERLEALERRQTESEIRLSTELVAVADAVREVRDLLPLSLGSSPR